MEALKTQTAAQNAQATANHTTLLSLQAQLACLLGEAASAPAGQARM